MIGHALHIPDAISLSAKTLPVLLLTAIAALLSFLLPLYTEQQQTLLLEGNNLRSEDAMLATNITFQEATDILPSLGSDARIIAPYDDSDTVLVVAANDYNSLPLPLHEGKGFSGQNLNEALIGSEIETKAVNGTEIIALDETPYRVVGRLGTKENSPLQHSIVLAPSADLDQRKIGMPVVDGAGAAQRIESLFPDVTLESPNKGFEERLSIDVVSPILLGSGAIGSILALWCAGLQHARLQRGETTTLHVVGFSKRRLMLRSTLRLSLVSLAAFALVCAVFTLMINPPRLDYTLTALAFTLLVPIAANALSMARNVRSMQ